MCLLYKGGTAGAITTPLDVAKTRVMLAEVSLCTGQSLIAAHCRSGVAGREELALASLNGKLQGVRVCFSRHNIHSSALWLTRTRELSGSDP